MKAITADFFMADSSHQSSGEPHSLSGLYIRNRIAKLLDGNLPERAMEVRQTSHRRGIGHKANILSCAQPSPQSVFGCQISHFADIAEVTWYHINVFGPNGQQWNTRARFSSF